MGKKKKKRSGRGEYDAFVPATERMVAVLEVMAATAAAERQERTERPRTREAEDAKEAEGELIVRLRMELREAQDELRQIRTAGIPLSVLIRTTLEGEDKDAMRDALAELRDRVPTELLEWKLGAVIEAGLSHCEWEHAFAGMHNEDEPREEGDISATRNVPPNAY
jgi:hypothetical protein